MSATGSRLMQLLDMVATVAFIVVCLAMTAMIFGDLRTPVAVGATNRPTAPRRVASIPTEPVSLSGAELIGDRQAKVVFVQYSDLQCPFCGKFARETWPALEQKYVRTGQVLAAFRHLPLPNHEFAEKAAEALVCAGRQGQFWKMHDVLFRPGQPLDQRGLMAGAADSGLHAASFEACLRDSSRESVRRDASSAAALGISGTPTFLIGVRSDGESFRVKERLAGALPLGRFEAVFDALLAENAGKAAAR